MREFDGEDFRSDKHNSINLSPRRVSPPVQLALFWLMRLLQESRHLAANSLTQSLISLRSRAPYPPLFYLNLSHGFHLHPTFSLLVEKVKHHALKGLCLTARTHNLPQRGCVVLSKAPVSSCIDLVPSLDRGSWLVIGKPSWVALKRSRRESKHAMPTAATYRSWFLYIWFRLVIRSWAVRLLPPCRPPSPRRIDPS